LPPTTAGIHPSRWSDDFAFLSSQYTTAIILAVLIALGLGLRMYQLGAESFAEDELNKLETAEEYRQNGLSGKNGEHPFLMKGLQTVSIIAADEINAAVLSLANTISPETALRFPVALFGAFTTLLLFLLVRELFGRSIALASAALWAVEPMAIGFDRVAKEDSLLLFFFLLTCFFWLRSQTLAEHGSPKYMRYGWLTAIAFAAVMATKYNPWLLATPMAYYTIYDHMSGRSKWSVGNSRWPIFFGLMAVAFVLLNPTILIPQSWHEMLTFSSENRIGHDSYEFMGMLYPNKPSLWLHGMSWTFYYVFIAVKTSLSTLILFLIGIPLVMRRRMGDGRLLLFFWAFFWFVPFTFTGGKFARYFAIPEPLVLICAGVGFYFCVRWISQKLKLTGATAAIVQAVLFIGFLAVPAYDSMTVTPHFRLFTNTLGGGMANAGTYFPHDEFYDAGSRETVTAIAQMSPGHALIACEAPHVLDYYADRIGVPALDTVLLSDPQKIAQLSEGDFVVITSGRRYVSNDRLRQTLAGYKPDSEVTIAGAIFAKIYKLDAEKLTAIRTIAASRN
jgi:hypothetical protein